MSPLGAVTGVQIRLSDGPACTWVAGQGLGQPGPWTSWLAPMSWRSLAHLLHCTMQVLARFAQRKRLGSTALGTSPGGELLLVGYVQITFTRYGEVFSEVTVTLTATADSSYCPTSFPVPGMGLLFNLCKFGGSKMIFCCLVLNEQIMQVKYNKWVVYCWTCI